MERKTTSQHRAGAGLSRAQAWVLILLALLSLAALALIALLLLPPAIPVPPPQGAAAPQLPGAAANAPTEPGTVETLPATTPVPPALLVPPEACAQLNSGVALGSSAQALDGRTLEVQVDGQALRVGLAGIVFPPPTGRADLALAVAADFAAAPPLLLVRDVSEQDAEGRLLRYVFSGDRFLNLDLVRLGLAQADSGGPDRACLALFQQAEQRARAERIGIWQPAPVPTATFLPFVTLDPARDAPCNCLSRPQCADFRTRADAQACYNACNDYNSLLDWDRDGVACEELP